MSRSRSSSTAAGDVSSASWIWNSSTSRSKVDAETSTSTSTPPPRPSTTRDAMSVQGCLARSAEQVDLMPGHRLHRRDAWRLDGDWFAQPLVGQDLAHLVVVGHLDVAGNIDLVDAELRRLRNLVVPVVRAAVQHERDLDVLLDLFEQIEFQLGLQIRRVDAVVCTDGYGEAVHARLAHEDQRVLRVGVDDGRAAVFGLAVGLAGRADFARHRQARR